MPKYKPFEFEQPTVKIGNINYLYVSIDLVTNIVVLKNLTTGERINKNFYEIKKNDK